MRVYTNMLLFLHFALLFVFPSCIVGANVTEELTTMLLEEHYEGKGSVYADDLADANKFLHQFDTKADELMNRNALTNWGYETDLSDKNLQKTIDIGVEVGDFFLNSSESASQIKTLDLPTRIARQISWIRRSADPTSDEMRREIKETIGKMTSIFGKGKVKYVIFNSIFYNSNSFFAYGLSFLNVVATKLYLCISYVKLCLQHMSAKSAG